MTDYGTLKSAISWDDYFMSIAFLVAMKSKDPSTKVGAVIVGAENEIVSTGFNGLPRNFKDYEHRLERPLKYMIVHHAEENAIINAARIGVSVKGCKIYVTWAPCASCAKMIIQSGIKEVIYYDFDIVKNDNFDKVWQQSMSIANEMFNESSIVSKKFNGKITKPEALIQGEVINIIDKEL